MKLNFQILEIHSTALKFICAIKTLVFPENGLKMRQIDAIKLIIS